VSLARFTVMLILPDSGGLQARTIAMAPKLRWGIPKREFQRLKRRTESSREPWARWPSFRPARPPAKMLVRFRGGSTVLARHAGDAASVPGAIIPTRMKKHTGKGERSARPGRRNPGFSKEIAVLYEDDAVIAVAKPAGLNSVPVRGTEAPSAWAVVSAEMGAKKQRAFAVHRIDRFSSGILLFAKTAADRDALVRQFLNHSPVRRYLAVVRGHLAVKEGTLVHHFRKEGMFQVLSAAKDPKAARAELQYLVERPLRASSLVQVSLVTGLQNQIRAQLSAIGHPVVGDRKYHPEEASERRIARVALHAVHLQFRHPRTKETISIDCEPPSDFQSLVRGLSPPPRKRK
jgi:23S rRNA pseudouridine1911/1915/1917 synthase